jgi:transposase InsO family protein
MFILGPTGAGKSVHGNQIITLEQKYGGFTCTRGLLTDNGKCYTAHGIKPRRTRRYTPRTNGKAERFIQTALREWAYARTYKNSDERTRALISFTTNTTGTDRTQESTSFPPSAEQVSMTTTS